MFNKIKFLVLSAVAILGLSSIVMATMPSVDDIWNQNGFYIGRMGTKIISNVGSSTAPATSACGTSTVSGSDSAFIVTITAGTPSACTITFGTAYATAPACVMTDQTTAAGSTSKVATTTTTAIATIAAGNYGTDVLSFICVGRT
jgi:hypothetical protein